MIGGNVLSSLYLPLKRKNWGTKKISETYSKLYGQWLVNSDREYRSEPCMEFYLNAPDNTESEDLLTDICLPLKPKD